MSPATPSNPVPKADADQPSPQNPAVDVNNGWLRVATTKAAFASAPGKAAYLGVCMTTRTIRLGADRVPTEEKVVKVRYRTECGRTPAFSDLEEFPSWLDGFNGKDAMVSEMKRMHAEVFANQYSSDKKE